MYIYIYIYIYSVLYTIVTISMGFRTKTWLSFSYKTSTSSKSRPLKSTIKITPWPDICNNCSRLCEDHMAILHGQKYTWPQLIEAVIQRRSLDKLLWKLLQNLQKRNCIGVFFKKRKSSTGFFSVFRKMFQDRFSVKSFWTSDPESIE